MLAVEKMRYDALVAGLLRLSGEVRFVAVDGCGGAGKSTFADRLAAAAAGAPVIRTDDFASWDEPMNWWPRLLHEAIEPLADGRAASYQRSAWDPSQPRTDNVRIEPAPIVLIEGVSAGRSEWRDRLAYSIWVEAPRDLRLKRGLDRDGPNAKSKWAEWMVAEDTYISREDPITNADLVVDGAPTDAYDPAAEFVVLSR
jgi:uridine kinase